MKLSYTQLMSHLGNALAPIYLISSDEILLLNESVDAIRQAAIRAGFSERITVTAESNTDFEQVLYEQTHELSLFSTKRIVELNLCAIKFTQAMGKQLEDYAKHPSTETILVIYTHKLDTKFEKSTWYQTIEKHGVTLPIWPIPIEQLPMWMIQRAKKLNLTLTKQAADHLALEVEGNLLAAAQEIEKLSLLLPNATIDHQTIDAIVTDNARFDLFHLVDSALSGNRSRSLRILNNLAAEGSEPTLILWALTREIRTLSDIHKHRQQGMPLANLFTKFRIWEKRQPGVRAFLQRHTLNDCLALLIQAAGVDRIIKGSELGNPWEALENLTLNITNNGIIKELSL